MTNEWTLITSKVAGKKISRLLPEERVELDNYFEKLASSRIITGDARVSRLDDGFFAFRVNNTSRLIFTVIDNNVIVSDLLNYDEDKKIMFPDIESLLFYRELSPDLAQEVDAMLNAEIKAGYYMHKMAVKNQQFFNIGTVTAIFLLCLVSFLIIILSRS